MLDLKKARFEGARLTDLEKAAFDLGQALVTFVHQAVAARESPVAGSTKLYSVDDLAKLFGKAKCTVRQWISTGEFGEPVKTGNSVMIPQAGLDKYLADHSGPLQRRDPPSRSRRTRSPAAADLSDMRL